MQQTNTVARRRGLTASSVVGVLLLLAAAVMMAGWLTRAVSIVRGIPGAVMVFSTALCFALSGLALAASSVLSTGAQRALCALLGGAVALIGGLALMEHATPLGFAIDWPDLHRWLADDNPHPGRMSVPTAAAFLALGTVLILMHRVRAVWTGLVVQGLTIFVVTVGVTGTVGWVLNLHWVYPHYLFGQMSLATAAGLIATGAALWLGWRRLDWYRQRTLIADEGRHISLTAAGVLALMVCASLVAGFAIMARQLEEVARRSLLEPLKSRIELFHIVTDTRATRVSLIAGPAQVAMLRALDARPGDAAALAQLRATAESVLALGFSAIAFERPDGRPWLGAGRFVEKPELELALAGRAASLLWDEGFVLRTRTPLLHEGSAIGVVIAEQRMHRLSRSIEYAFDFAATGEVAVCGRRNGRLWCFPQRSEPRAFAMPDDPSLPSARALSRETGISMSRDHRGVNVIAAHGPIGTLGLGMVVKMEAAELYAPLRRQMPLAVLLLAAMVAAGALLLYWRIAPLARGLYLNEQRLKLALDSSKSAVWDLDLRSGRVYLSEQWPALLGEAPKAVSATLEELYALVHPDDVPEVRRKLRVALKADAAQYDAEHRVRNAAGEWTWIHSVGRVVERDAQGRAQRMIGVNTDIARRKQAQAFVERRASRDEATGLPNRSVFGDRLHTAMARARRAPPDRSLMALLHLRLEECKEISEEFGQAVGQDLLRQAAQRLTACVRATDTVARMGLDEFAVILEELGLPEQGIRVAEKLIAALERDFALERHTLSVSTSVGMAFYDGVVEINAEQLAARAHHATFDAHNEGRNRWHVAA